MPPEIITIYPTDQAGLALVDGLLAAEGIKRDPHLDYTCAVMQNDSILASGSLFKNTLRCVAVSSAHQGEGLMNLLVSHLIATAQSRGYTHLFVYTKVKAAKHFADLGFHEIARVADQLVFLENRRDGFAQYCQALTASPKRPAAAIIMNANPFSNGHRYLLAQAAKANAVVHLFMVSDAASFIPYAVRKQLILAGIADLPNVIPHDTGDYLISSATFPSYFLKAPAVVIRTQAQLDTALFIQIAHTLGISRRYVGTEPTSTVTSMYNDVLKQTLPQHGIALSVVPRLTQAGQPISASAIRQALHDGQLEKIRPWVPETTYAFFNSAPGQAVIAKLQAAAAVKHY
ncbi:[citrate (pro-3S)-lyase] ligase [Lacticaseibacillus baoqingensis]|uniref:[Citrate [pro-3S]-lyase] ligase n=1 Tax=Lacticaseibacillus baoqingensis TaxID=2486013 RepID=A0ABW4E8W6_9LACO|nr:[citrate (pro-3S)-lyase] ligase [Lacticaseibacillus baoqingensis]